MENDFEACLCDQSGGNNIDNYPPLRLLLPSEYDYIICFFKDDDKGSFKSRFHTNCYTKDQALKWLEKFSALTKLEFGTEEDFSCSTQMIHVKCHCSVIDSCSTMLKITINSENTTTESLNQSLLQKHPASVIFHYSHNLPNDGSDHSEVSEILIEHDLDDYLYTNNDAYDSNDDSLSSDLKSAKQDSFEPPTPTSDENENNALEQFVRKKLYYLFEKDYSPQQAYNLYKKELHEIFEKEFQSPSDRIERPGLKWVQKHYYTYLEKKHGVKIPTEEKNEIKTNTNGTKGIPIRRRNITAQMEKTMRKMGIPFAFRQQDDPLGKKINEQLKKYVPILPASSPPKFEPEISVLSLPSPIDNINPVKPILNQNNPSTSYIIKFNSENKTDKLNLFPLKLIPNTPMIKDSESIVPGFKLPELKIIQNSKNKEHILEVTATNNMTSQNIPIPSGVDGIIILASEDDNKPNISNSETHNPPITESSSESRKHRRKPCLKYEDPDEIVFTDNIEDLKEKVETPGKKSKRKLHNKNSTLKKQKVILPCALDGIENVICHD